MGIVIVLISLVIAVVVYVALANRKGGSLTLAGTSRSDAVTAVIGALGAFVASLIAISGFFGWKPYPSDTECKEYASFVRETFIAFKSDKGQTLNFIDSARLDNLDRHCGPASQMLP
jgi:hypothetical protein